MSLNIRSSFSDTHKGLPARWFDGVGPAKEFMDLLLQHNVSFRMDVVRGRRQARFRLVVMYVAGPKTCRHDEYHVVPLDDTREHYSSVCCWCGPEEDDEEPGYWIHNAADNREHYEAGGPVH